MTIIKASEVQQGDKIAVTLTEDSEDRKRTTTYTGVAAQFTFDKWRTPEGWQLYTERENAVIELLDRPKPNIEVPTGIGAVVEYQRFGDDTLEGRRVATLTAGGKWRTYGEEYFGGLQQTREVKVTEEYLTALLNDPSRTSDFKVLFEGVK